jgi:hypothetical protein
MGIVKGSSGSLIVTLLLLVSIFLMACVQTQETQKVPVIEVNFNHYLISGQHVVKINSLKKVEVEKDKVRITTSPPFPGIHVFAIYPLEGKVQISPIAFTNLNVEGEITVYLGIEKDKLPQTGTNITVVVEVRDAGGKRLAVDRGVVKWV